MRTCEISKLFDSQGLIIYGSEDERIDELDSDMVISSFENKGVILFRDFS